MDNELSEETAMIIAAATEAEADRIALTAVTQFMQLDMLLGEQIREGQKDVAMATLVLGFDKIMQQMGQDFRNLFADDVQGFGDWTVKRLGL